MKEQLIAAVGDSVTAQGIIDNIVNTIFEPIAYLLFSLGFLVFMWGLIEFIANPTKASIKEKGKQHMIFGILGLLIMVSVWGIVNLITSTLGIDCGSIGDGKPCAPLGGGNSAAPISPDRRSGPF